MALLMFSTPHPPYALENANGGFQSRNGAETMTQVTTTHATITPTLGRALSPAQLHRLADHALCLALHHLRHCGSGGASLRAATAKANRALTLLKHASKTVTTAAPATATTAGA
jgi:hypothetical protein